ncbi:copper amine oxidase N-terminal domain-containing protein [Caloranaerobacter sp. DY30410]|uniref:copper amine oxidase N-terminal domain-containing protein n=1 Tax=Caloranaerobacter sp. DY30410 TaxID=3238305 RepID=UPI003D023C83
MTNTKRKNRLINIACILMILIVLMGNIFQLQAFAEEEPIKVKVNGKEIEFEQPPVIINGSTLVPLRKIFEALGISVEWDSETKTVFAFKGGIVISIQIGSKTAMIQDEENIETEVELDVPSLKLVEYERSKRASELMDELLGNW